MTDANQRDAAEAVARAAAKSLGFDYDEECGYETEADCCDSSTCLGGLNEDHDIDDCRTMMLKIGKAAVGALASLPAASEGESCDALEAWQELVEYDDRTSPEEHPNMALITFEELRMFMSRAAFSDCTCGEVAGEDPDCAVHAPSDQEKLVGELVEALELFQRLKRRIMIDVGSCHSLRGPGASSEMRSDDRDMREEIEAAYAVAETLITRARQNGEVG